MNVVKIYKEQSQTIMCCDCRKNEAVWLFEERQPFTEKETHYKPYCEKCAETFSRCIWKR